MDGESAKAPSDVREAGVKTSDAHSDQESLKLADRLKRLEESLSRLRNLGKSPAEISAIAKGKPEVAEQPEQSLDNRVSEVLAKAVAAGMPKGEIKKILAETSSHVADQAREKAAQTIGQPRPGESHFDRLKRSLTGLRQAGVSPDVIQGLVAGTEPTANVTKSTKGADQSQTSVPASSGSSQTK